MERGGRVRGCKQGAQSYRTGSVLWIERVARANRAYDNEKHDAVYVQQLPFLSPSLTSQVCKRQFSEMRCYDLKACVPRNS